MERKLEFRFGRAGKYIPVAVSIVFIAVAAVHSSNINGYVTAFFIALIVGVIFARDERAYGEAVISGLSRPMFGIISMAVILASIAGKLISGSGLVQTLAGAVTGMGHGGGVFAAGAFLITCVLSMATGTSVGTYMIVIPILFPVGIMAGADPAYMIGAIVSGAAFGDNLAPVSDTTIASAGTQGADMGGTVRSRCRYSLPAAAFALVMYALFSAGEKGAKMEPAQTASNPVSLVMLAVPAVIILLCLLHRHLITALSAGCIAGAAAGLITGLYRFSDFLAFPGQFKAGGILPDSITGAMGTVAMLFGVFGMLGILDKSGIIEEISTGLYSLAKGVRSAEAVIVGSVAVLGMVTGVISVAIVAVGDMVRGLGEKQGIDCYRRANLMDCAGCGFVFLAPWTVHCVMPAQLSGQLGEAFAVVPTQVASHNFYAIGMIGLLIFAVVTGYARTSGKKT